MSTYPFAYPLARAGPGVMTDAQLEEENLHSIIYASELPKGSG